MLDFLQSREELLSTPSLLAEALEVLTTLLSALARPNTKHSFEPLHNSSMSGEV
jgi:hypothetical protein